MVSPTGTLQGIKGLSEIPEILDSLSVMYLRRQVSSLRSTRCPWRCKTLFKCLQAIFPHPHISKLAFCFDIFHDASNALREVHKLEVTADGIPRKF